MKKFLKAFIIVTLLISVSASAYAGPRRWYRNHYAHIFPRTTVVVRPAVTVPSPHRITQKDRLAMVVAWLDEKGSITARQYANMTGFSKTTAEAELDVFAQDPDGLITAVISGKKKVYVLR